MAVMFANFGGLKTPILMATLAGATILLVSAMVLAFQIPRFVTRDCSRDAPLIIGVLLSYSLLFAAGTALGRVCLGSIQAQSSRYTTLLIPAFLALYLYLLTVPAGAWRKIALGLFAVLLIPNCLHVPPEAAWFANGKRAWSACYLQTETITYCDQVTGFPIYPYPERNGLKQKLDYLKQHRLTFFADSLEK